MSPYEVYHGTKPFVGDLEIFGARCWVVKQGEAPLKVYDRPCGFMFVGMTDESKGLQYWDKNTGHIKTSRSVYFEDYESEREMIEMFRHLIQNHLP